MTKEERQKFRVITNTEIEQESNISDIELTNKEGKRVTSPIGYSTNPMYEKLLQFRENQRKKRFTVEDLLKW